MIHPPLTSTLIWNCKYYDIIKEPCQVLFLLSDYYANNFTNFASFGLLFSIYICMGTITPVPAGTTISGKCKNRSVKSTPTTIDPTYSFGQNTEEAIVAEILRFLSNHDDYKNKPAKDNIKYAELITSLIILESKAAGVNPKMTAALMAKESSFDTNAKAKGSSEKGLGQVNDGTAKEILKTTKHNMLDPQQNAKATALLLKRSLNLFKRVDFTLAAHREGFYGIKRCRLYKPGTANYIKAIDDVYRNIKAREVKLASR